MFYSNEKVLKSVVQEDLLFAADQANKLAIAAIYGKNSPRPISDGVRFQQIEARLKSAADAVGKSRVKRFGKLPENVRVEAEAARQELIHFLKEVTDMLNASSEKKGRDV